MVTIIDVEVPVNRFEILGIKPNAWQLLLAKSLGIEKGNKIKLIEVDGVGDPTGRTRYGTVVFLSTFNAVQFDKSLSLYYVDRDFGIGFRIIESTFYVG